VADTVGGAKDEEDSDDGNEKIKDDSEWERKVLHGGERPGHRMWWRSVLVL